MCAKCVFRPTVKVDKKEQASILFDDLVKFYNDRETAKEVYYLTQTPIFKSRMEKLGIETDELGEPTIKSLREKLNLDNTTDSFYMNKLDLNAIDEKGNIIYYKSTAPIIDSLIKYNDTHTRSIARIAKNENGYYIDVIKLTPETFDIQSKLKEGNEVFKRLLPTLNALGFAVKIDSSLVENGVFDPMNATSTAEGLLEVIAVADNKEGIASITEELAHMFIEGLKDTPAVTRLLNMIADNGLIENILEDSYERYSELYDNNYSMLLREAAGHLLRDALANANKYADRAWYQKIFDRIAAVINNILGRLKGQKNVVDDVLKQSQLIADSLYSGEYNAKVDSERIKVSPKFNQLIRSVKEMRDVLQKGLELQTTDFNIKREKAFMFSKNPELQKYQEHIMEVSRQLQAFDKSKTSDYRYIASGLLQYIAITSEQMVKAFSKAKITTLDDLESIKAAATAYSNILQYKNSFIDHLKQIRAFSKADAMILGIPASVLENIATKAGEVVITFEDNLEAIKGFQYDIIKALFKVCLGIDPDTAIYTKKMKKGLLHAITLDMLLKEADRDLSRIDAWIVSFSDTSDALFSLISLLIRNKKNAADDYIRTEIVPRIIAANTRLRNAGITDTSFMYERVKLFTQKGKEYYVTHIISDIDWVKYNEALNKEFNRIAALKVSREKKKEYRRQWLEENNDVNIANQEYTPKLSKYSKEDSKKVEKVLNKAQYEYYDEMMREATETKPEGIKRLIENTMLPEGKRRLYRPIYMRDDLVETVMVKHSSAKTIAKNSLQNVKDKFVRRVDEDAFGNPVTTVKKNLDGTFRETLPLMYITPLEDNSRLSVDFTSAIIAYASTSAQYATMEEIVDGLELIRDVMKERKVQLKKGNIKVKSAVKKLGMKAELEDLKLDYNQYPSRMMEAFNNFYANVVYGRRKENEGTMHIFGHDTNIDVAKMQDFIKAFTTQAGLGFNPFSGISNLVMGKFQFFVEQIAGEFFNMKNGAVAEGRYAFFLPQYLAELTSTNKLNTMHLFIEQFDALDAYRDDLKRRGYYNSLTGRIFGEDLALLMQTAGEHRLHVLTMFAILDTIKCKIIDPKTNTYVKNSNGKDKVVTLFDAFEKHITRDEEGRPLSGYLKVKDNYVLENGRAITPEFLNKVRNTIHEANGRMHGKFNADDRGNINRIGLGRLGMQFRQWMVTHYRRRFEGEKYNALLDYNVEGFYVTMAKLFGELYSTIKKGEFSFTALRDSFTKHQLANLKRAFAELLSFAVLSFIISISAKPKDLKGKWAQRLALYTALRLRTEIGASIPSPWHLAENLMTLLQSPAASLSKMNAFVDLLAVWDMATEIQSGRYKGMSVWRRNLYEAVPYLGPIRKAFDLSNEEYMFTPFNSLSTKFRKK